MGGLKGRDRVVVTELILWEDKDYNNRVSMTRSDPQ